MNLASAFAHSAEKHANSPGLFWGDTEFRYADILQQACRASQILRKVGVPPGARVGIWLKNCPEFVAALYGVWLAEGVVVPINNFLRPGEVGYILNDAAIDVLISETALSEGFDELRAQRPHLQVLQVEEFDRLAPASNATPALPPQSESDLAVIIYTSGTTGHPKGAMLSHGNLLENVESCRQMLRAVSFDRFVVLLPMFHSFMLTVGILLPLTVGARWY